FPRRLTRCAGNPDAKLKRGVAVDIRGGRFPVVSGSLRAIPPMHSSNPSNHSMTQVVRIPPGQWFEPISLAFAVGPLDGPVNGPSETGSSVGCTHHSPWSLVALLRSKRATRSTNVRRP